MNFDFSTALVVSALISAITLALDRGNRLVPAIALVACVVEALIAFRIIHLSVSTFRVDVILPAILVVTGAICWSRSSTKSAVTAATVLTLVGAVQLLLALRVLH
jgi:hypothetical protein